MAAMFGWFSEARTSASRWKPLAVGRHRVGEDLDGDLSLEVEVRSAIDLAHSAHADLRGNFVRAESSARDQRHCRGFYAITAE
jgi:hypothetical protein